MILSSSIFCFANNASVLLAGLKVCTSAILSATRATSCFDFVMCRFCNFQSFHSISVGALNKCM